MPQRKARKHWREDISELPNYFAAAWRDVQPIHTEAQEYARNYYDKGATLSTAAQNAVDLLRQQGYTEVASLLNATANRGENLTLELVESAKAMICNELSVTAVAKGDSKMARNTKTINRLIEGVLDVNDAWGTVDEEVFDTHGWHPIAFAKVWPDMQRREIKLSAVDPTLMCWSLDDGPNPESLYEQLYISRTAAAEMLPEAEDEIMDMDPAQPPVIPGVDATRSLASDGSGSDLVLLIDCWTKKVGERPGRHIICGAKGGRIMEPTMGGTGD